MDRRTEIAFQYAADVTKQIIAISTAILILTITFIKDILHPELVSCLRYLIVVAWFFYFLTIVFGVLALAALTGTLQPKTDTKKDPTIWERSIVFFTKLQIFSFLIATLSIVLIGVIGLFP